MNKERLPIGRAVFCSAVAIVVLRARRQKRGSGRAASVPRLSDLPTTDDREQVRQARETTVAMMVGPVGTCLLAFLLAWFGLMLRRAPSDELATVGDLLSLELRRGLPTAEVILGIVAIALTVVLAAVFDNGRCHGGSSTHFALVAFATTAFSSAALWVIVLALPRDPELLPEFLLAGAGAVLLGAIVGLFRPSVASLQLSRAQAKVRLDDLKRSRFGVAKVPPTRPRGVVAARLPWRSAVTLVLILVAAAVGVGRVAQVDGSTTVRVAAATAITSGLWLSALGATASRDPDLLRWPTRLGRLAAVAAVGLYLAGLVVLVAAAGGLGVAGFGLALVVWVGPLAWRARPCLFAPARSLRTVREQVVLRDQVKRSDRLIAAAEPPTA